MAIVEVYEDYGKQSSSGKYGESASYSRTWIIRSDNPEESITAIQGAPGVNYRDGHPNDSNSKAMSFSVDPADDSGLLWTVRISYGPEPPDTGGEDPPESTPEGILKFPVWSAGSSVVSVPCFQYYDGEGNLSQKVITNSAGDPLEGLEAEAAEFRLSLTMYYLSHEAWMADAIAYTNAVNSDSWHGGLSGSWKCQGCSAQLGNQLGVVYWEVTWEFAHRDTWNLMPWDVGFHERVDESGAPDSYGTQRKAIVGQDKKPVKQPVALANGVALPPGSAPLVINMEQGVRVYPQMPFGSKFGTIYTPTYANT